MASNLIKIYIGRDVDCDYRITSIEISRKHALLEYSESDHFWQISDLNVSTLSREGAAGHPD